MTSIGRSAWVACAKLRARHCWISHCFLLFLLKGVLLADFFFNLFKCLQEELLYFTALIQYNLRQGTHLAQVFILDPQILTCVDYFLTLLFDDRLVLISDHFLLFFKVSDDLSQRLLKNLDLVFVGLNLVSLHF